MVCVLDRGLIVNVSKQDPMNIVSTPSEMSAWAVMENDRTSNLYLFYLVLQQHLNESESHPPNLLKYAKASCVLDDTTIMIPSSLIPDDLSVEIGNLRLRGDDLKFMSENWQQYRHLLANQLAEDNGEVEQLDMTQEEMSAMRDRFESIFRRFSGQE